VTAHDVPERCDRDCTPSDSVDVLLASWARQRPDLDMSPIGIVSRLGRVRDYLDAQLAVVYGNYGLTPPDFAVLVTLARLEVASGVSQRRLADELGLTAGTVSVRVDHLVEQGLVRRDADPDSKRNVLVTLTDHGQNLFDRVAPAHLANADRLLTALTADERDLLTGLLRKLLAEFEGSEREGADSRRLGLRLTPAHVTIEVRMSVGLPPVPGLLVRAVEERSPAAEAGVQVGDVLIEAGDRQLRSSSSLYAALNEAGDALRVTLLRGNHQMEAQVTLPRGREPAAPAASGRHAGERGHSGEHSL
jgi:DNA-binding MarR family transcriptional regulator